MPQGGLGGNTGGTNEALSHALACSADVSLLRICGDVFRGVVLGVLCRVVLCRALLCVVCGVALYCDRWLVSCCLAPCIVLWCVVCVVM